VQSLRKKAGFTPDDRISIIVDAEKGAVNIIIKNKDIIAKEVLADEIKQEQMQEFEKEFKIQDKQVRISLKILK